MQLNWVLEGWVKRGSIELARKSYRRWTDDLLDPNIDAKFGTYMLHFCTIPGRERIACVIILVVSTGTVLITTRWYRASLGRCVASESCVYRLILTSPKASIQSRKSESCSMEQTTKNDRPICTAEVEIQERDHTNRSNNRTMLGFSDEIYLCCLSSNTSTKSHTTHLPS